MIDYKQLKKYVEKHGEAKLASQLGYKTGQTVLNWIQRKSVPMYMAAQLKGILDNEFSQQGNKR
jgi:hypothetical protein